MATPNWRGEPQMRGRTHSDPRRVSGQRQRGGGAETRGGGQRRDGGNRGGGGARGEGGNRGGGGQGRGQGGNRGGGGGQGRGQGGNRGGGGQGRGGRGRGNTGTRMGGGGGLAGGPGIRANYVHYSPVEHMAWRGTGRPANGRDVSGGGVDRNRQLEAQPGRRGRGGEVNGTPGVHRLGMKTLEELSRKEPSEAAITLSTSRGLKDLLAERSMGHDMVQLLCQALCLAFSSKADRRAVQQVAGLLKDSVFFCTILPNYVTGMMSDNVTDRRGQYPQHLDNIIAILSKVVSIFPSSSIRGVSTLVILLSPAINQLRASGVTVPDETDRNLEKVKEIVEHLQEKAREGTLRNDNYTFLTNEEDAPPGEQDFRSMSIYPTPDEFHFYQKPFLRPNITAHRYASARIYLDTHFRLLREDFVRPLREGIRKLLDSQQDPNLNGVPLHKRRFDDIMVYHDTRLVVPLCTPSGIAYRAQFDPRPLKFVRWQNSKRLLYGSLVCLSTDNFETFLFATVCDRDVKALENGQVLLTFSTNSHPQLAQVQPSDSFVMVETTAYFEAYRYVLEGLQEQELEDLPFQRYIVECQTDVLPPAYQRMGVKMYDLSSIAADDFKDAIRPFNPLDAEAWPTEEQMGLDESQLRALKQALTQELAIIQGPPGTGKTHVGLKIAQALLKNQMAWGSGSPMLVVCYTNHALDQFLEGIHKFLEKGIVRVGGRSNSDVMKQFSLRALARSQQFQREIPPHLRRAYFEIRKDLLNAQLRIEQQTSSLECTLRGVVHEQFLVKYINMDHWESLSVQPACDVFQRGRKKTSMILEWLGLGLSAFQIKQNAAEEDEAEQDLDEDLIHVDEEADLIHLERVLEDGDPEDRDSRRKRKNREQEQILRLEKMMLAMNLEREADEAENAEQEAHGQWEGGNGQWEMQRHQKKKMKQTVKNELKASLTMTEEEEEAIADIWILPLKERWKLYRLWVLRYQTDMRTRVLAAEQEYQTAAERLAEIRMKEDTCVLSKATVIGMTTTGAAKFRQVLQDVAPRLVIVEEAAEVLEAHTITTLSRACQHLILIGDHQQLRPSATVFDLAQNFNLEVSMFERLVKMEFPYVRLNYQHRMRPDIARLLTPHIYDQLENHPCVLEYDNVKGVNSNLFFVEHECPEEEIQDGRSRRNKHEALFVVELCRYLLRQEYKPSQITILTTYTGQLHCLRQLMPSNPFSGVRVHVVDKYQGEENDIVILSLVRSNLAGIVGFLQIPNRVCVALSRAKKGLYCIGNMNMLSRVKLWSNIFHTLREEGQVGPALTLSCQNHPDRQTQVMCGKDFEEVPEGGCKLPCEFRLDCGHACTRVCHPYDADHKKFQCQKTCHKILCELQHRCQKRCYEKCGDCREPVEKVIPKCQHKQKVPCHVDPAAFSCKEPCQKTLGCGHGCRAACGDVCTACMVPASMELDCGHVQEVPCHITTDPTAKPRCKAKCALTLMCGHPCPGTCHSCHQGRFHRPCKKSCQRILVCSHECREPCTANCPPCGRPCKNRCVHSTCGKTCGQPCPPCTEPCPWCCPHYVCGKLCHEPCDRPPCDQPCEARLRCGHPCIGFCGDPCPNKCRVCHLDDVKEIFFGTEDDPDARFIQLEDCGHLFEATGMDMYMAMDEDEEAGLDQLAIKLKECPRCRTPIRRNLRYGRHINRSLAEIERVKEKINGAPGEIKEKKEAMLRLLVQKANFHKYLPVQYKMIVNDIKNSSHSLLALWHQENLIKFFERLATLTKATQENIGDKSHDFFSQRLEECTNFLMDHGQRFSEQQVWDLDREMQRLKYLAEINVRCKRFYFAALESRVNTEVERLRQVLEDTSPFSEVTELWVQQTMKDLEDKLPCSGLGITDQERVMIVQAMGLNPGHWYKCVNNHVYVITECGGAMESRKCPECNVTIGGANHQLAEGNRVASEMDGAQHAAWSNAANMQNYNLMDL
ncbi:NFX1-type zinc finger-containing protein 1 [Denticeps clupeoides]|uniref:RZ-type domain-containing protein n=1 Tax=Denticeps clupeoides TaxID=299321 RepID=A0AAY4EIM5_9TELE|nr:NFX1-type zinc finger-containing protein 1 [Denticeps clupeoides]